LLNQECQFVRKIKAKSLLEGARVLLVEDRPLVALEIAQTLMEADAEIVGPVGSVEEAVALAKSEILSCAVLDVMLEGKEVYPAAQVLNEKGAGLLFLTAIPDTITNGWPHAKVVRKPFSEEQLIEAATAACVRSNGA
jgi:DNA-binding response OmpR family regulator